MLRPKGLVSCYKDNYFQLESCKWVENMQLIILGTLWTHVLVKEKDRCHFMMSMWDVCGAGCITKFCERKPMRTCSVTWVVP
jgi:hypothetical protein